MVIRHLLAGAALLAAAAPASADWYEAKSRHFIIYSEQKPEELREHASRLERFDQAVRMLRGMDDPALQDSGRLTVYVLRDDMAIEELVGRRGVKGFYIPRASGAVTFVHRGRSERGRPDELTAQGVFFHEYFHHLMLASNSQALPMWLVEGMAEFFGTAQVTETGGVQIGRVPQHRAYGLFNLTGLTTEQMVGATTKRLDEAQRELTYGRGWLLSHYLLFEPSRVGQLDKYVNGIQQGKSALDSGRAAFGDLKQLDKDLKKYLNQNRMVARTIDGAKLTTGPITIRPLSEGESAIMRVRIRSDRGVDSSSAPDVARDARAVAARFPNDAVVQEALAEAEHDADNLTAAEEAATKAVALDPRSSKGLIYRARALMAAGRKDKAKADWKTARSYLAKANRLDPDDAEPLMLFYQTYLQEGVAPTANSKEGLYAAHQLAPQDAELRILAVEQLISDGKHDSARQLFEPIAFNPHAGDNRERYLDILAALEAKDGRKAQELLRADPNKGKR